MKFLMRMLAKVPRIITSWLPRRVPYWLKSATATLCCSRYSPAGDDGLMEPAGEMWSVVILSPNSPRMRAPEMSVMSVGRCVDALEVRRIAHVGGLVVPGVGFAAGRIDGAPAGVAVEHVGVAVEEQLAGDVLEDELLDLLRGRPDVLQVDELAVAAGAERLLGEILLHRTGERVGDDERRRGEVVGLHVGADAAFEVAVAGEHGGGDDAVLVDGGGDFRRQAVRSYRCRWCSRSRPG